MRICEVGSKCEYKSGVWLEREREREIVQGRVAVIVLWSLSRSIVLCWAGLFQTDREERPALE